MQCASPVLERARGTGRGAPAMSSGRKQPKKPAGFRIKITVKILAQERGTETHSSREGINASHRRLLKGVLWCSNWSTDRLAEIAVDHRKIIRQADGGIPTISGVSVTIRQYEPHDFGVLYKLDQACFPPGIPYSKTILRYFLAHSATECLLPPHPRTIVRF